MTRVQTVLITSTVFALVVPFAAATAQTANDSCGPETWSTDKMTYVTAPCTAGEVGTAGPTAGATTSSSSMTKAEMKQGTYYAPAPQIQAVSTGANYASMADRPCGPANAAALTDEYGHKYNCRGDRLR
jgi:hypothetical protein